MKLLLLCAFAAVAASIDTRDLHRAQTMIPRAPYKGETPIKMSETLNGHMVRTFPNTKPCEQWTVEELQEYQSDLYHYREPHFDAIYQNVSDNRRLIHDTLEGYQAQWSTTNQLVRATQSSSSERSSSKYISLLSAICLSTSTRP
jgi:hypothetical protein